jgi:hypothetical protein
MSSSDDFAKLVSSCDLYVLQLHSLELPRSIQHIEALFDAKKSMSWVYKAASFGRPFAISLPTYGYFLGFDKDGRYLGVSSEQGPKNWEQTQVLLSDFSEIAQFMKELTLSHPKLLEEVYWFRLGHVGDLLNWSLGAFEMLESAPTQAELSVEILENEAGLAELYLQNNSPFPLAFPAEVLLECSHEKILFIEALSHFFYEGKGDSLYLRSDKSTLILPPGNRVPLCWIRFKGSNSQTIKVLHVQ